MGNGQTISRNTMNVLNKTVNDITSKLVKRCEQNSNITQDIKISVKNIRGCSSLNISDFNQNTTSTMNTECETITISSTELQTVIKNNFEQVSKAANSGGLFQGFANKTTSENITNLDNLINNISLMEELSTAISNSSTVQNFELNIDGFYCTPQFINGVEQPSVFNLSDINQNIVQDKTLKGLLSSEIFNKAVIDVDNSLVQDSSAISGGGGLMEMLFMIIVLIIVLGMVGGMMKGGGGGGGNLRSNETSINSWIFVIIYIVLFLIAGCSLGFGSYMYLQDKEMLDEETTSTLSLLLGISGGCIIFSLLLLLAIIIGKIVAVMYIMLYIFLVLGCIVMSIVVVVKITQLQYERYEKLSPFREYVEAPIIR